MKNLSFYFLTIITISLLYTSPILGQVTKDSMKTMKIIPSDNSSTHNGVNPPPPTTGGDGPILPPPTKPPKSKEDWEALNPSSIQPNGIPLKKRPSSQTEIPD